MSGNKSKKAFDIGRIPKKIDLTSPPMSGFEYLYRVRLESRRCPKVVVSDMDRTRFLTRQTVLLDLHNGFIRAQPGFEPDPEWQDEQIETFCTVRKDLFQNREASLKKFPRREFPKIALDKDWCLFCLGSDLKDKIFSPSMRNETEHVSVLEVTVSGEDQPKAKRSRTGLEDFVIIEKSSCMGSPAYMEESRVQGTPPLLSIVLYLNQTRVTRLLAYHVSWLEAAGFTDIQGQWLYALLVCLEKPLDPDTCALLRSLSRVCSKLRGDLQNPDDEALLPLNLILTIVSRFFDQKDMSDCFSNE